MLPNLLSLNFKLPFVAHKIDASNSFRGLRGMPRRILVIGQAAEGASIPRNKTVTMNSKAEALGSIGQGSLLHATWLASKENARLGLPIDVIALDADESAVKAAGSVAITLAATNPTDSGEVMLYLGGYRVAVGVNQTDTVTTIATKLTTMINSKPELPVVATAAAGVINFVCKWAGATGNDISIKSTHYWDDRLPTGLTITVTPMAGGALNPDVTPVIVAMSGKRYTEIVMPYTDTPNLLILEEELKKRWEFDNMADGQLVVVVRGTEGQSTSWLAARNCHQVHSAHVINDLSSPWELAGVLGAVIESSASIDPAAPYTGLPLVGYKAAKQDDDFEIDQKSNLRNLGGSVLEVMEDGTANIYDMATNYVTHPTGAEDQSWRNLEWVKSMSYYRWYVVTEFQIKYRDFKLAEYVEEPIPGQKIMTKDLAEEIMLKIYQQLCDAGLMQNMEHYQSTLKIEVDGANQKLKIIDEPVLIVQHKQTEITSQFAAGHV